MRHTFHNPFAVASLLLRGQTLIRALLNLALKGHQLHGKVLDLGGKSTKASYYRYLQMAPHTGVVCSDLKSGPGLVALDVEAPFDLPDAAFDAVLAFHLFEHVFHFQRAPDEVLRVLKPGGRVLVAVPFLHEYHADPDDYFRFTDSGLRRWWESAGLRCIHMEAIGEGLFTAWLTKLPSQILPGFLRSATTALLYLVATIADRLIALRPRVNGRTVPERFALEFFAIFEKPR